jgi:hypothetical protein
MEIHLHSAEITADCLIFIARTSDAKRLAFSLQGIESGSGSGGGGNNALATELAYHNGQLLAELSGLRSQISGSRPRHGLRSIREAPPASSPQEHTTDKAEPDLDGVRYAPKK